LNRGNLILFIHNNSRSGIVSAKMMLSDSGCAEFMESVLAYFMFKADLDRFFKEFSSLMQARKGAFLSRCCPLLDPLAAPYEEHLLQLTAKATHRKEQRAQFTALSGIFHLTASSRGNQCETAATYVEPGRAPNPHKGMNNDMSKILVTLALLCASLQAQVTGS